MAEFMIYSMVIFYRFVPENRRYEKMGKLIVIEGTDGSGKSTQFRLLSEHLEQDAVEFKHLVFPRYAEPSSELIRMYLGGEF